MKNKGYSVILIVLKSTVIDGVEHPRGSEMFVDVEKAQALTAEMPDRLAIAVHETKTLPEEESEDA
jgi:hypothetical protein